MHPLDIGLAFLEGLALIVSPCILPVLPLVLAASVDGGRGRPFGIILGFVLAFSAVAVAARQLVALLGIDLDVVKTGSLVLLALFGLVLLSARLSARFNALTAGAADVGQRVAGAGGTGFGSGLGIGALIGLVWTPCAGPILAAVLVQVVRQQSDLAGYLVILSFAIGAGVPMLLIALSGRRLMARLAFFARHGEAVRKGFGALILLSVAAIATGADAGRLFETENAPSATTPFNPARQLAHGLETPYAAPAFAGITTWLNSPPLTMDALKGKVVLVDFWTYSCINCVRTLPHLIEWDRKYRDQGLVIVGVHAPEFEFEKKLDNVEAAMARHGIKYPVAIDNDFATWSNYQNRYWPAHYLIDREGRVVYTHFGEGKYEVTENNIRYLLGLEDGAKESGMHEPGYSAGQTPETYLGADRAERFAGDNLVRKGAHRFPTVLAQDAWALQGKWRVEGERIVAAEKDAALRLRFHGRKVFLVLGTADGKPVRLHLRLDGAPPGGRAGKDAPGGVVTVERNTLYELIDQSEAKDGLLEIRAEQPGVEAYAFTFG